MADTMPLDEAVKAYLSIAMLPPEKQRKTQRERREDQFMIIGFNRAQETLRTILENYGNSDEVKALADVRADGQQQPIVVGGTKAWVAG